jgi:hypothetical protein
MKNIIVVALLLSICCFSCKKERVLTAPDNIESLNYDTDNGIFRVKVTSTKSFNVTITELNTTDNTTYNLEQANQTGPFDYGFTPIIGHTIKISIQSAQGLISYNVMYKGIVLNPASVQLTSGGGSYVEYSYVVK